MKRKQFLNSAEGVTAAKNEFKLLHSELERLISSIKDAANSITLNIKIHSDSLVILGLGNFLSISWQFYYGNTLDNAQLKIILWDRYPPLPGVMHFGDSKEIQTMSFTFDLFPSEQLGWVSTSSNKQTYSTNDLAAFILKYYMDHGHTK